MKMVLLEMIVPGALGARRGKERERKELAKEKEEARRRRMMTVTEENMGMECGGNLSTSYLLNNIFK